MRMHKMIAGVLGGMAIFMASSALAADKGSMKLFDPTLVNGTQLSAGEYQLQWDGTGSDVQLKIFQGKKLVVSASAAVEQLKTPARQNITEVRNGSNNEKVLTGISFRGKNYALVIGEPSQKTEADVAKK